MHSRTHVLTIAICLAMGLFLIRPAHAQGPTRPNFMGYYAYWGILHQHSGYSTDACGMPWEVIEDARNRGNDFLAMTEHDFGLWSPNIGDYVRGRCIAPEQNYYKWETMQALAEQYTRDGSFVVLRGFEYTPCQPGHINIFNSDTFHVPRNDYGAANAQDNFYSWLAGLPRGVFAQFNHPMPLPWSASWTEHCGGPFDLDFNHFSFFPPVAPKMRLIENSVEYPFGSSYPLALSKEWQASSVGYGDDHSGRAAHGALTYGIFAPELTRASVSEALLEGRAFGNSDGELAVALLGNGRWMGSAISSDSVQLNIYAAADEDFIEQLELIGPSGVITTCNPMLRTAEWTVNIDNVQPGDFFYVHVIDSNGDQAWSGAISRPRYMRLQTDPATVSLAFSSATEPAQTQSLWLQANDGADAPWSATALDEWVSVSPAQGDHLPALVNVTISPAGMAPGLHTSAVVVQAGGTGHLPTTLGVQAEIGTVSPAVVRLSPRTIARTISQDEPQFAAALTIQCPDELTWAAAASVPWLSVSSPSGHGNATLGLNVDLRGYPWGDYTGHAVLMVGNQIRVCEVRVALQPPQPHTLMLQQQSGVYEGVQDTTFSSYDPDTPFGNRGDLRLRSQSEKVTLIRFDLTQIPTHAQVFSATLALYAAEKSVEDSFLDVHIYEVLKPWEESSATWREAAPGVPWASGGAQQTCEDIACRPLPRVETLADVERWYFFDVASLVRNWIAHPEQNLGLVLSGESSTSVEFVLRSSEYPQISLRPYLELTYSDATATPMPSPTATPTATSTATPTVTPSATATPTLTPTATPPTLYLPLLLRAVQG